MTTALLIAGNMCDARLWRGADGAIPAVLAARGFAVAEAETTIDDTIAGMASRALAATSGPLLPIGFSMGGIVALAIAAQAADRVAGLVLADTNAGADLPERAAVRPEQQARVRAGALATIVTDELKPAYLAAANRADRHLRDLLFAMAMDLGDAVFCRQSEALRTRADGGPVLERFAGPVLFLVGAEDALCPPAWHYAMAARTAEASVAVIDHAGHMLPLEAPAAFAATLDAWLDHHPGLEAAL